MEQFAYYNQNYPQANIAKNRVYINRNFNRTGSEGSALSNSNVMYFNPNFPHTASSQHNIVQSDPALRPRIHVNPNFIRPKIQDPSVVNRAQINTVLSTSTGNSQLACVEPIHAGNENQINTQMATVSNSRYCLVRQKENKLIKTPHVKTLPNNTQQTVRVNKYKSVSLNSVKMNLAIDKSSTSKLSENTSNQHNFLNSKSKYRISSKPISNSTQNMRFKFVKRNSLTTLLNSSEIKQGTVRRVSITLNKSILKTNPRQTRKIVKGAMKKNNIPCPLFKKYGKCLRMVQGNCAYLHDKKHVSICRKFLKGICHNKQCLLSHDLTDKKMPTCFFFLQGNCTKEGCPYLHVKLNEKTKICQDFLKGYCEKGDKCILRHVNIMPDTASKLTRVSKQISYTHINKSAHTERARTYRRNTLNRKGEATFVKVITENVSDKELAKDQRYFRDIEVDTTSEQQCDLIKPTRCKLGTLPSYIQL